jgi:DnaJ-class molecular chaperone
MKPNYYTLLGISANASTAEIRQAYRRLARQHHPDLHDRQADSQMKHLNEAYAVLSDEKKRAAYDAQLRQARLHAEALRRQQEQEPEMTWMQGMVGFVRELKKAMRDD